MLSDNATPAKNNTAIIFLDLRIKLLIQINTNMTFFRSFNPYLNVLYGRLQYLISQSDRCYFKALLIAL